MDEDGDGLINDDEEFEEEEEYEENDDEDEQEEDEKESIALLRPGLGEAGYEEWLLNNSWGIEEEANMTVREIQLRQSLSGANKRHVGTTTTRRYNNNNSLAHVGTHRRGCAGRCLECSRGPLH